MKYMGDYPSKRFRQTTDLTDAIFEPALLHVSDSLVHEYKLCYVYILISLPLFLVMEAARLHYKLMNMFL